MHSTRVALLSSATWFFKLSKFGVQKNLGHFKFSVDFSLINASRRWILLPGLCSIPQVFDLEACDTDSLMSYEPNSHLPDGRPFHLYSTLNKRRVWLHSFSHMLIKLILAAVQVVIFGMG
ncbi:hypothetical protein VNO78_11367 [Psophocarpus tetragonolobus]|uniref:Uncharacterized protein n=1 Tax=Psophocarpus tetragonolobus TaxID=3891 RepID=A0AAN9SLN3_PSOTE